MKMDIENKDNHNYDASKMKLGDTWLLHDSVYIIAWIDGVTLNYPSLGVNTEDSESYNVLIDLEDGLPWREPDIMSNIAKSLREENAIKVDTKVVTV